MRLFKAWRAAEGELAVQAWVSLCWGTRMRFISLSDRQYKHYRICLTVVCPWKAIGFSAVHWDYRTGNRMVQIQMHWPWSWRFYHGICD
jgi:hypothetical protein